MFITTINRDVFNGGAANDIFDCDIGGGVDLLRGGAGQDRFFVGGNAQRGRIDGGIGTDSIIMRGHNNHTFADGLIIAGIENLFLSEPNFFGKASQLNGFTRIIPETDSMEFGIFLQGQGGVLDLSTSYMSTKRLQVDASGAESRVVLTCSDRADDVFGSEFGDVIVGGRGKDLLDGGDGNDVFRYTAVNHSLRGASADIIGNFDDGNDKIDLSALRGPVMVYRHSAAFTNTGQVRIQDVAGPDVVVQVNLTGNLTPEMEIRLSFEDLADLSRGDFIL
ncbi:MAG TPA: M10 family metallopeptidase C-terminal domain-containing protein [Rhizobiaceae bacterium]|nr:M10 family metallopeptidase C-terminal domain-containing protein [Rhizobiaceae bacterium]